MKYLANTLIVLNNNCLLFKNNIEYAKTKIMQNYKMTKKSIKIFFKKSDFAPIPKH